MKNALREKIETLKEARYVGILLGKSVIENSKIIARLQEEADRLKGEEDGNGKN
jgi:hypothetical protein